MKKAMVVVLLGSIIVIGTGCSAKKATPSPVIQPTPQSDSATTITQNTTGDCSPNIVSTGNQNVNIQLGCPAKPQHNVTKVDRGSIGTITQSSTGNNAVNVVSTGEGSVNVVITGNDGFKSPQGKILFVCDDGSKPTDGVCADGTVPRELHLANHKK